jgi:hypothetical protein
MKCSIKFSAPFLFILLLVCLASLPALADTDYRCLNLCTNSGRGASQCMTQCSYVKAVPGTTMPGMVSGTATGSTTAPGASNTNVHNLIEAPVPAGDEILLQRHVSQLGGSGTNYRCVGQCTKAGMQYQLCTSRCADACFAQCEGQGDPSASLQSFETCSDHCPPVAAPTPVPPPAKN